MKKLALLLGLTNVVMAGVVVDVDTVSYMPDIGSAMAAARKGQKPGATATKKIEMQWEYYFEGNDSRVSIRLPDKRVVPYVVALAKEQRLVILNEKRKEYMQFTKADAQALDLYTNPMMQMLPPEARAQLQQRTEKPTYQAAGSKTVGSWKCNRYVGTTSEGPVGEICVVPFDTMKVKRNELAALDFVKSIMPQGAAGANFVQWGDELKFGFPVEQVSPVKGVNPPVNSTVRAVSVRHANLAKIAIPAGYAKAENDLSSAIQGMTNFGGPGKGRSPSGKRNP